ncbi:hypothetical protein DITRI_Ditri08aG0153200 [Diplodiscus trichospermus]
MIMRKAIKSSVLIPAAMLFLILLQFDAVHPYVPVTYKVGDDEGWDLSIDMQAWARGKDFHSGDVLEFIYDEQFDVVVTNKTGHDTCTRYDEDTRFNTGDDKITLVFGANYFIDSVSNICAAGMKMAIDATAPPP